MIDDLRLIGSSRSFVVAWLENGRAEVQSAINVGDALGIYHSKIDRFLPSTVYDS